MTWCNSAKAVLCWTEKSSSGTHTSYTITADKPFEEIMIDITGPLPRSSEGYSYILGVIDVFSRYCSWIPLKSTETKHIIDALMQNWISIFGFNSRLLCDFCKKYNVEKVNSCSYYPEGNSIIERLFRTSKDMIYATSKENGCG